MLPRVCSLIKRFRATSHQTAKTKLLQFVFSCPYRRVKIFVFAVNCETFVLFLCDLVKDYKNRIKNQRKSLSFAINKRYA